MAIRTLEEANAEKEALERKTLRSQEKKAQRQLAEKVELKKLRKIPSFDPVIYKGMTNRERDDYRSNLRLISQYETKEMDEDEARKCVEAIKNQTCSVMRLCYELWARNGYKALGRPEYENGYPDFKACIMNEFNGVINYAYAHKMKNAGEVHIVVCPQLRMGSVPESVLRPMHKLDNKDDMKKVWNSAIGEYIDKKDAMPTAREISDKVKKYQIETGVIKAPCLIDKFRDVEFSPKLKKKMSTVMMELVKEFIEQTSSCPTPPVTKDHFDKTLNILLNSQRTSISEEYEKYIAELSSNYVN
ncbi:hypothetical protein [Methylobacter psychrophilus]|uniref:hypothetical protein n=1 Tax=Methylobacter psychrophilus TaxID=96941 RepID=UPI0021D4DBED|nr:hypothetical protein [Methylobacter psychrophilus]